MSIWDEGNTIDNLLSNLQTDGDFLINHSRRKKTRNMIKDVVENHYVNKSSAAKEDFVRNFIRMLDIQDDEFISSGDVNKDYETITSRLDTQGYWAGLQYRYFFDEDYNFLRAEERQFGNSSTK